MAIPDFQSLMLPLLQFAGDGQEHSIHEAEDMLARTLGLSNLERNELYASGGQRTPKFAHRIAWAKTYLKQAVLIQDTRRAHFRITQRGLDVLAEKPSRLDMRYLERFPEYLEFKSRTRISKPATRTSKPVNIDRGSTSASAESTQTPREAIETNYQRLRVALAQEILATIKQQSPRFFERLVVELLVKMGYGGSIKDAGEAIGRTGDEGIDGIIKEDKLGLDIIYIQAKRWDRPIGRPEIHQFAGALDGQRATKGVFITTSAFTSDARSFTTSIAKKIVLIDGEELAQLMIDNNVGVTIDTVYELKRIDFDFFAEE
jgi:restriction system protein